MTVIALRWWATALLVFSITVLGTVTWFLSKDRESNTESATQHATPGASAVRWAVGISQHYRFEFLSSMQLHTTANAPVQVIPVNMRGGLAMHTLNVGANTVSNGIQLSEVELTISNQNDTANIAALQQPFRVSYASGGIPVSTEFPATVDAESRVILQNLIKTFQFTLIQGTDRWTVDETHPSGSYVADYTLVEPHVLLKSKREFTSSQLNPMLSNAKVSSTETVRMDPLKNWIVSMSVDERLSNSEHGGPGLQITNQASLNLTTDIPSRLDAKRWNFTATATNEASDNSILQSTVLPTLSPMEAREELLAELPILDTAVQSRTPHIHRLRDLLRIDDSLPDLLVQQMTDLTLSDRTRADLYLALELAGTAAAQNALTTIFAGTEWSLKDGVRAIIALGGVSNPEPASINALWESADTDNEQLASTALFALGSLGNTLNTANDESYATLRDSLLSYAYGSQEPQQKADYISALGNTRDDALAGDLTNLLNDAEPIVRRASARALGQVGAAESISTLTNTLRHESSATVRAAIVDSLTQLPNNDETVIPLITSMIQTETEEQARFAMAGYLEKFVAPHGRYKPVLQTLIRHEPSKRVRQRLGEALATMVNR